jgi:hypothetical protein
MRSLLTLLGVQLPHGSEFGYDCSSDTVKFISSKDPENELHNLAFRIAFGQDKVKRVGEANAVFKANDWKRNNEHRIKMKEYFDLYYWRQPAAKDPTSRPRIIYIVFGTSLITTLNRLLECNTKMDAITVIALPFRTVMGEDTTTSTLPREKQASQKLIQLYKQISTVLKPVN